MKKGMLILFLAGAVTANSQSLKDALYGGKLKLDTGAVIRKGDDLSTKIDTTRKKPVDPEKIKTMTVVRDTSVTGTVAGTEPVTNPASEAAKDNATATKDNNKIWKDYMDEFTGTLRTDVLPSKKIKNGTYSILIEYEIGLDGQITVNNVSCSPESSYLEDQVKERLTLTAPQMSPLLSANGKPRKAIKKQTFTVAK
jgi:hypothetical protein